PRLRPALAVEAGRPHRPIDVAPLIEQLAPHARPLGHGRDLLAALQPQDDPLLELVRKLPRTLARFRHGSSSEAMSPFYPCLNFGVHSITESPIAARPRRPVAVKSRRMRSIRPRLRRSFASLRPLRTIASQSPCGASARSARQEPIK